MNYFTVLRLKGPQNLEQILARVGKPPTKRKEHTHLSQRCTKKRCEDKEVIEKIPDSA